MNRELLIRFVILLLIFPLGVSAQQRVSVGFWNVENLYDTIPSPFYDDSDYTPKGRLKWDTGRYQTKLTNIARVIDDAGFDVIGLAEVENEAVVRDLVMALSDDYNYIHFNSSDRRGIDLAMLYKGDKFFPERAKLIDSHYSREFLHVRGELLGDNVNILLCHLPSKANNREYRERAMTRLVSVADSLQRNDRTAKLIVMGDFNCDPSEKIFRTVFGKQSEGFYYEQMLYGAVPHKKGTGTYAWDSKWMLFDNILLSMPAIHGEGLVYEKGGIFIRDYMLAGNDDTSPAARKGYPLRTFSAGRYTAGFSDHLPIYTVISQQ